MEQASERANESVKTYLSTGLAGQSICSWPSFGRAAGAAQDPSSRSWAYLLGVITYLAVQPSLGLSRQPGVPGQVFNIAVLPRATPARSSNDLILFFPSRAAPPLCKDARRFYLANLTFRSWVRPLTLLHERHDALLMSVCPPSRPRPPLLPPPGASCPARHRETLFARA